MVLGGDSYHAGDECFFYFQPSRPMMDTRDPRATVAACSAEGVQFPAVPRIVIPIIDSDEETSDEETSDEETSESEVDSEEEQEESQALAQPKKSLSARFSGNHQQGARVSSKKASMKTSRRRPSWMKLRKIGDKDNNPFPSTLYRRELMGPLDLRKRKSVPAADMDKFSDRTVNSVIALEESSDKEAVTVPHEEKELPPAKFFKYFNDAAVTIPPRNGKSLPQKRKLASLTNCGDVSDDDTVTAVVKKRKSAPTAAVHIEDQVKSLINQLSGSFC